MRNVASMSRTGLALVGLLFVLAIDSRGDVAPAPPDHSRIEALGGKFVEAMNATDSLVWISAARELFSASAFAELGEGRIVNLFSRMHDRYGQATFHHAEVMTAGSGAGTRRSLHVFVRGTKQPRWNDLQFVLDAELPHRIHHLIFIAEVSEPVALPNGAITSAATIEWLDAYVTRLAANDSLAGGILVAQGNRILLERAFGSADPPGSRRITEDSRFGMASGGKMFTALLVARLVEQGRLSYEDVLADRVPTLRDWAPARGVTLAQLLSHTSGIADYWTDEWQPHHSEMRTTSDFVPWIRKAGVHFAPGERFEYSNSNFILAGLVLEAATGRPYADVLRDSLFAPLGMKDSGLTPPGTRDPRRVVAMSRGGSGWVRSGFDDGGSPAGGCATTLGDLLRFSNALREGRIVRPATLRELTTIRTRNLPGEPFDYGYGFTLGSRDGQIVSYGHGGIAPGVNFEFRIFPEDDVTLIVYSNQDNGAYDDLRKNATRLVTGER